MENSSTYPKIVHLSAGRRSFKIDRNDPNFDKPLSELEKTYESPYTRTRRVEEGYGEFEIITLS